MSTDESKNEVATPPSPARVGDMSSIPPLSSAMVLTNTGVLETAVTPIQETGTPTLSMMATVQMQSLARQERINRVNASLHAVNFFVGYANSTKYKHLKSQYEVIARDIVEGQRVLQSLTRAMGDQQDCISDLKTDLVDVSEDVKQQSVRTDTVTADLEEHKQEMQDTVARYDAKLRAQDSIISSQQEMLVKVLKVRFRIDFLVDLSCSAASYYLATSGPATSLLEILIQVTDKLRAPFTAARANTGGRKLAGGSGRSGGKFSHSSSSSSGAGRSRTSVTRSSSSSRSGASLSLTLSRLLVFLLVNRYLRGLTMKNGLHNTVGTYWGYLKWLTQLTKTQSVKLAGVIDDFRTGKHLRIAPAGAAAAENNSST